MDSTKTKAGISPVQLDPLVGLRATQIDVYLAAEVSADKRVNDCESVGLVAAQRPA